MGYFLFSAFVQHNPLNVFKINPLGALFGAAQLSYERAISKKSSFLVSPTVGYFKSSGIRYNTYGLGASYRFYFSKKQTAPMGFYASPGVSYLSGKAKFKENFGGTSSLKTTGINVFTAGGYQWIWQNGFSIDISGGLQYVHYSYTGDRDTRFSTPFSGPLPMLGLGLGYAF